MTNAESAGERCYATIPSNVTRNVKYRIELVVKDRTYTEVRNR